MNSTKKFFIGLLILIIGGVIGYFIGRAVMTSQANAAGASLYGITATKSAVVNGSTGPTNPGCPTGVPCSQTLAQINTTGTASDMKDGDTCVVYSNNGGVLTGYQGTWSTKLPGCVLTISNSATNNSANEKSLVQNNKVPAGITIGGVCKVVGAGSGSNVESHAGTWALSNSGQVYCKTATIAQEISSPASAQ